VKTTVSEAIEQLFAVHPTISSGQVAIATGVTRQTAHNHLRQLAKEGEVVMEGAGRGTRYRRLTQRSTTYRLEDLEEHRVWMEEYFALKQMDLPIFVNPRIKPILDFTFTEMVNNAIDHSGGTLLTVRWFLADDRIAFEIEDDGVGAFRRMRESRGLISEFDSIGEISKGKQTSAPRRHSGLGIYFSSRMANKFVLASGQFTWTVDNNRDDNAIGWLDESRVGTLVRCEVEATTMIRPVEVFDEFSDPSTFGFNKTRVRVSLFNEGDFISRSEAKRLGSHLESFGTVELDFQGIESVGQGFVDELFRVWQSDHPETRLTPIRANPAIMAMIAKTVPISELNN
jgi:hypothetical protein